MDRNTYSVPSRLIGEQMDVRLTIDRVEVWYGQRKIEDMPRLRGQRKHRVDYRHIIDWPVRKPGAFENYRYRDELFPTSRFRMAFDVLEEQCGSRAHKKNLCILELAGKESEAGVDQALRTLLNRSDEEITAERVKQMLHAGHDACVRDLKVAAVDLRVFAKVSGGTSCATQS